MHQLKRTTVRPFFNFSVIPTHNQIHSFYIVLYCFFIPTFCCTQSETDFPQTTFLKSLQADVRGHKAVAVEKLGVFGNEKPISSRARRKCKYCLNFMSCHVAGLQLFTSSFFLAASAFPHILCKYLWFHATGKYSYACMSICMYALQYFNLKGNNNITAKANVAIVAHILINVYRNVVVIYLGTPANTSEM